MDYTMKDGTFVSEEWMNGIAEAAEVDELQGIVVAVDAKADVLNESDEMRERVWAWQEEIDRQADIAFEKGAAKGEARLSELMSKLLGSDRFEDAKRVATDTAYRESLFKEFGIA